MDPKKQLQDFIKNLETKKFRDGEAKGLVKTIGDEITVQLKPAFESLAKELKGDMASAFKDAINSIKVDVPKADAPTISFPEQKAPIVNIPAPIVNIPAPVVNIPATVFPEYPDFPKEFSLKGVTPKTPLHVQMVDQGGKPMMFPVSLGASGGKADFFTILGITNTVGIVAINPDGTTIVGSTGGLTDTQLRAASVPVEQVSGSVWSTVVNSGTITAVTSITNSIAATILDETGNPWQPFVYGTGDAATAQRVIIAGNSDASVVVNSGTLTAVTSITNSVASALVDSSGVQYSGSNPLPTTATLTLPAGPGDAATATRVVIAGNSDASVVVNSGTLTAVTSITNSVASALVDSSGVQYSGANPIPVAIQSALNQGDVATALRVVLAGNSDASVVVNSGTITAVTNITNSIAVVALDRDGVPLTTGPIAQGDAATALRVIMAGNSDASVVVNSGTITAVTSITNSVASALVDSSGVQYSGSNPLPTTATLSAVVNQGDAATALRVVVAGNSDASVVVNSGTITAVTSITNTVAALNVDSSGVGYSGSNPLPVTLANAGTTQNVTVAGATDSFFAYEARTTNPTAKADGADIRPKADKLGRALTRPFQMRDLTFTAYVALANGTETTLLAASAGNFHDLLYVFASNTSTVTQAIDIREVTGGNIVLNIQIPANGVAGVSLPIPFPQSSTGNNWTVDGPDNTNSTINVSALFSRET